MQYLDDKIENHQNTLDKYKSLYELINGGELVNEISANIKKENYTMNGKKVQNWHDNSDSICCVDLLIA